MNDAPIWPTDKMTALRLGRRLVMEIPASRADRQAFVDIVPGKTGGDVAAQEQRWTRSDAERSFHLEHWEYDRNRVAGFDYDIGAVLVETVDAADESELIAILGRWRLRPEQFVHPWDSDDPR